MFTRKPGNSSPLQLRKGLRFHHAVFPDTHALGRRHRIDFTPHLAVNRAAPGPELSPDEQQLTHWLFKQAGLDAGLYRPEVLKRRLPSLLRTLRARDLNDAYTLLRSEPHLVDGALSVMIIGVTRLFRDAAVFEALRPHLLAMAQRREERRRPRILSVGCSDGAELYSVAMLLAEAGVLHHFCLRGVDCRREALAQASAGIFDSDGIREAPERLRQRFLMAAPGRRFRVVPALTGAVQWRCGDAMHAGAGELHDLILCRNLAIYIDTPAVGALWEHLSHRLSPGGLLVVGSTERPSLQSRGDRRRGKLQAVSPCIYRWSGDLAHPVDAALSGGAI